MAQRIFAIICFIVVIASAIGFFPFPSLSREETFYVGLAVGAVLMGSIALFLSSFTAKAIDKFVKKE